MISATRQFRRAFTLLELLVVLGILLLLIGLFIGVGVNVTRNQKASQTRGVLDALNRALDEYIIANSNNIPPPSRELYACTPGFDGPFGRNEDGGLILSPSNYLSDSPAKMPQRPDASVFIRQARGIGDVDSILAQIPERFLVVTAVPGGQQLTGEPTCDENMQSTAPSVVDAWAEADWRGLEGTTTSANVEIAWPVLEQSLIYYVHPNLRRNRSDTSQDQFADAQELYGSCVNGRPYFFSAGADGFYGHPMELNEIEAHYSMSRRESEGDDDYYNRVLRQARLDNLYSTPVDIEFRVPINIIMQFINS